MRLCKWCYHVRIKGQKDHPYHVKCKGNNECECRCRELKREEKTFNTFHSSNLGMKVRMRII